MKLRVALKVCHRFYREKRDYPWHTVEAALARRERSWRREFARTFGLWSVRARFR